MVYKGRQGSAPAPAHWLILDTLDDLHGPGSSSVNGRLDPRIAQKSFTSDILTLFT